MRTCVVRQGQPAKLLRLVTALLLAVSLLVFQTGQAKADGSLVASGWEPLGGVSSGSPAATTWGPGRLDVFVRGSDNNLWHKWYAGAWSGWESLGSPAGGLGSDPAAVAWGPGRIDVLAAGVDGQLWHKWYAGGWSGWEPLGGGLLTAPAVASWGSGRLDVFVEGTDHQLWHKWYAGGWSGWEPLGGVLTAAPAAVSWGPGRIDVVVRGSDNAAWHTFYDRGWHGFDHLGGQLVDGPGVTAWAPGRLDVFVEGTDNNLYHRWYAGGWSGWQLAATGPMTSGPGVVSWAPGRVDVFARSTDDGIYHLGGIPALPPLLSPGGWAITQNPNSTSPSQTGLTAVSCLSASDCFAVGSDRFDTTGDTPLVEHWDGNTWTVGSTPSGVGGLSGIFCTSHNACVAVGWTGTSSSNAGLVLVWDGLTWTASTAATPSGTPTGNASWSLSAVSCTSGQACTAVGGISNAAAPGVTLVERWDGHTWTIQPSPSPMGTAIGLTGVSCTSAQSCVAVGSYTPTRDPNTPTQLANLTTLPLAERWDGQTWTILSVPLPSGTLGLLNGISCTSARACVAAGGSFTFGPAFLELKFSTLVEAWDGTTWAIQSSPNVSEAEMSRLNGVSCTSPNACTAVGTAFFTGPLPNPPGDTGAILTSVVTLAEHWDGHSWTIQPTPTPTGTWGVLNGVSCLSSDVCHAVGASYPHGDPNASQSLAERHNAGL